MIVAPATPPGVSALAVVRLSGPAGRARAVARRLAPELPEELATWSATKAAIVDAAGQPLDDAVLVYFAAPRSPTGEEVVEISCHGSPAVVAAVLSAAVAAGARRAARGEFTRRALANGKLDLAEAEGVARLAAAGSREGARAALGLVRGALSLRVEALRERLLDVLAAVEAAFDFSDDVEFVGQDALDRTLGELEGEAAALAASGAGSEPERLKTAVLLGRPNAGKSTLFNALLGMDRAIVTAHPGTTRDAIAETLELDGARVRLVDTAGLRAAADEVERIGVEVAHRAAGAADVLVYLVDGAAGETEEDLRFLEETDGARRIAILTKADLPRRATGAYDLPVSAATGEGLHELRGLLAARLGLVPEGDGPLVLARHRDALARAAAALAEGRAALRELAAPEVAAACVRRALGALGEITGETATEELLDRIFSTFCLGK